MPEPGRCIRPPGPADRVVCRVWQAEFRSSIERQLLSRSFAGRLVSLNPADIMQGPERQTGCSRKLKNGSNMGSGLNDRKKLMDMLKVSKKNL